MVGTVAFRLLPAASMTAWASGWVDGVVVVVVNGAGVNTVVAAEASTSWFIASPITLWPMPGNWLRSS